MLAELLDQLPFNMAIADLYKTRFNGVPGVVYAAGVRHAYNVAEAFRDAGHQGRGRLGRDAQARAGRDPRRATSAARSTCSSTRSCWPRAGTRRARRSACTSRRPPRKRIYQQRVGRVTRRHPGKEAGVVVDFVHPATKHDDPVVTLHSLLDRDVYRGGAIVVGPVRRGRGRRVRVERRVIPVTADEERRHEVFERELWRIAVEHLDYGEQHMWAALAGARVAPSGWRRARAMLHFDRTRRAQAPLPAHRRRAQQQLAAARARAAGDRRGQGRRGVRPRRSTSSARGRARSAARAPRSCSRRSPRSASAAATRPTPGSGAWPSTRARSTRSTPSSAGRRPSACSGLLVNSSGGAHARNARRLVHAARKQDRRLQAALLAAAVAHTPEAEEVLRGARTRLARKPSALSRELLRNFPKGKGRRSRRRRKKAAAAAAGRSGAGVAQTRAGPDEEALEGAVVDHRGRRRRRVRQRRGEQSADGDRPADDKPAPRPRARRSRRRKDADPARDAPGAAPQRAPAEAAAPAAGQDSEEEQPQASADGATPTRRRRPRRAAASAPRRPATRQPDAADRGRAA